jgi:hypothetical protein
MGILVYYLWECKLLLPLWKRVWSFWKKLKLELLYDPAILPWVHTKGDEIIMLKV